MRNSLIAVHDQLRQVIRYIFIGGAHRARCGSLSPADFAPLRRARRRGTLTYDVRRDCGVILDELAAEGDELLTVEPRQRLAMILYGLKLT